MSGTTCSISIMKNNGEIQSISSNYDGSPDVSGDLLIRLYSEINEVVKLISKGNISKLGEERNFSDKSKPLLFKTKKEYFIWIKRFNFNYLFHEVDKCWYLIKKNKEIKLFDYLK